MLARADPTVAQVVKDYVKALILPATERSYQSGASSYVTFCEVRGLPPWPAEGVVVSAWMIQTAASCAMSTVKSYLTHVRSMQRGLGYKWTLSDDFTIKRTKQALVKKWGLPERALKVPVTVAIMKKMFACLPGYPNLSQMSSNNRLFVAATLTGSLGLLRGGEFGWVPGGSQNLLKGKDVRATVVGGHGRVEIDVQAPKAKPWLSSLTVIVHDPEGEPSLSPSVALQAYRDGCPVNLGSDDAAFRLQDGRPMTRKWMVAATALLCRRAGVLLLNARGRRVPVKASSWRAGGVLDARRCGLSDAYIKAMGRWSSDAHLEYSFRAVQDLRADTTRAVRHALAAGDQQESLVVGRFNHSNVSAYY